MARIVEWGSGVVRFRLSVFGVVVLVGWMCQVGMVMRFPGRGMRVVAVVVVVVSRRDERRSRRFILSIICSCGLGQIREKAQHLYCRSKGITPTSSYIQLTANHYTFNRHFPPCSPLALPPTNCTFTPPSETNCPLTSPSSTEPVVPFGVVNDSS